MTQTKLSVVIPVYNGSATIEDLVEAVFQELSEHVSLEIVLINDFSKDTSWEKIEALCNKYPEEITGINMARNFGEHNAVMAGYNACNGDYIVNIDDDFQNPPSEIIKLLRKIQEEKEDVVYGVFDKKEHAPWRNLGSWLNNKVATIMLGKSENLYLSSFRIISNKLLQEIKRYEGPYPYVDGLILRSTGKIGTVLVEHHSRKEGTSNYTLLKLFSLWSHTFINFSILPIRFATLLGVLFSFTGFIGSIYIIIDKFLHPETPIGWPTLMVCLLIFSGVQLLIAGIIGEYIGRIFITQNKNPQFVIGETIGKGSSRHKEE